MKNNSYKYNNMKNYIRLLLICIFVLVNTIEANSQKPKRRKYKYINYGEIYGPTYNYLRNKLDKKVDSLIRLGIKQNLFFSLVKRNPVLDKKGLLVDFRCKNWEPRFLYLTKIDTLLLVIMDWY